MAMVITPDFGPVLCAQTPPPASQAPVPTPQQLDQLLSPIALYPDSLLAQITTACTNPQEILDVSNWLQANQGLKDKALTDAAEKQGFDPAFIALTVFPQVIDMMAQNIDDYAAIGAAFSQDQALVSASIQRLRAQAYTAGSLRSNEQQKVEVQQSGPQTIYVIQPANPQVVYVPVYNPTVVYVAPATSTVVATSLISFGAGIAIGALIAGNPPWGWGGWGWGWSSHSVYYNRSVWVRWGNPYRPPNYWYRPRPVHYNSRPGYGGNWGYRPPNYRPPSGRPPSYNRPPYSPNHPPGNRPPGNNNPGYRPPANKPRPTPYGTTRPAGQTNKPQSQPRPAGQASRPQSQQQRPAAQPKPRSQSQIKKK